MKKYSVILLGAGNRGSNYSRIISRCPEKFNIVAVAEPVKARREEIKKMHGISDDMCFETWEDVLKLPKFADLVLICVQDDMHYKPAMTAIDKGYNLLLEKPAAKTATKTTAKAKTQTASKPVAGAWYVQFGSYSTRALAESAQRQIQNAHKSLFQGQQFVILAAQLKDGKTTYRLRVAFKTASDANGFCRNAKSDGLDCYVAK